LLLESLAHIEDLQANLGEKKSIREKHNVSLLAGYDVQKFDNKGWGAQRTGLADGFFQSYQGSFLNIIPTNNNFISEKAFASVFGRISYDYDKRYFVTINYRRDGNSALGAGKKYGNFGGASVGWSLSDEKFYKSLAIAKNISSVKLRASWGKVGNGNLGNNYGSLSLYNSALYGTASTFALAREATPTWAGKQANKPT
jgi:hypothetical protein